MPSIFPTALGFLGKEGAFGEIFLFIFIYIYLPSLRSHFNFSSFLGGVDLLGKSFNIRCLLSNFC